VVDQHYTVSVVDMEVVAVVAAAVVVVVDRRLAVDMPMLADMVDN
jgi:hypothetical protein